MSVYGATIAQEPHSIQSPPLVHVRTDPYAGRKYHATFALPENTDLLGDCAPFSYTIWKRFRNEVCAECWRYDRGRRSFLTRRDDQEPEEQVSPDTFRGTATAPEHSVESPKSTSTTGAGLWFCDATCQRGWIKREGVEAVDLLRQLESVRQKTRPKLTVSCGRCRLVVGG